MLLQLFCIIFLAAILYFIIFIFRHFLARKRHSHIPAAIQQLILPLPIPLHIPLLHSVDHGNQFEHIISAIRDKPLVRNTFGTDMVVCINDPDTIKEIWVKRVKQFKKPQVYELFDVFGSNILTSSGDNWSPHRSLCSKAFIPSNYDYVAQVSNQSSLLLLQKWKNKFGKQNMGSTEGNDEILLELTNEFDELTFDILGKAGFRVDFEVFSEKGKNEIGTMLNRAIFFDLPLRFGLLSLLPAWLRKKCLHWETPNLKRVHQYIDQLIESRLKEELTSCDLLSLLVSAKQEENQDDNNHSMTIDAIRSNIFIFLIAGFETTSTQLSWTVYHLANNPQVQQKLYESVLPLFENGKQPTYEDYRNGNLQYALHVVYESMRLSTPIPSFTLHTTEKEETICGYSIPKNTLLCALPIAIHTDCKWWNNPLQFIPERFEQSLKNRNAYLPFSMGPRKCLGFVFSEVESVIILSQLVYHYKMELQIPNFIPQKQFVLTVRPKSVPLKLIPRHNNY